MVYGCTVWYNFIHFESVATIFRFAVEHSLSHTLTPHSVSESKMGGGNGGRPRVRRRECHVMYTLTKTERAAYSTVHEIYSANFIGTFASLYGDISCLNVVGNIFGV